MAVSRNAAWRTCRFFSRPKKPAKKDAPAWTDEKSQSRSFTGSGRMRPDKRSRAYELRILDHVCSLALFGAKEILLLHARWFEEKKARALHGCIQGKGQHQRQHTDVILSSLTERRRKKKKMQVAFGIVRACVQRIRGQLHDPPPILAPF